jgi:chromosome segregation ATPase
MTMELVATETDRIQQSLEVGEKSLFYRTAKRIFKVHVVRKLHDYALYNCNDDGTFTVCVCMQVANLERERDSLKEAVDGGDSTVRELGIRLLELQASESSLKDEVNRLKTKEDWMSARNDELMELIGRLEKTVDQHRAAEVELRSRLDRHTTSQTELGRELEEARDEARAEEARYRRWIGQLEDERTTLTSAIDELMERNTDLEGREAGLLCRIRRLEAAEIGLKSDVAELERALSETGSGSYDDAQSVAIQAVVDVDEVSTQTDAESMTSDKIGEENYLQMVEKAEFFKEMWEFCEQSNTALENKLKQCTASEAVLRGSVKEYENIDKIWQGKVENLEERNASLVKEMSDLKLNITDLQVFHSSLLAYT